MERKIPDSTRIGLLVVMVVAVVVTVPLFATAVVADEPRTADDYFDEFRTMEGTDAYEEYDEFETIRTFAVTQVQDTGSLDASERAEFEAIHETMMAFEQAYDYAEAGEYERSLEYAERTDDRIDDLESTQATLADLALTRFYEGLAGGLHDEADAAERTPDRIEYLSMTATAYERANMPDEAAEFNVQVEQETAAYESSLEQIDEAEEDAEAFLDRCADCESVGNTVAGVPGSLETFENYQQVRTVSAEISAAESEAAAHGLEDREEEIAAVGGEVWGTQLSLAVASVTVLVGYGVVVGLLGTILLRRIFAWQRTYERAQVGSVVTVGDSDV
ncbi:hypothetical protein [Natronobacterium texcoconense]|uniref:Uncharacterized protein n=1 Tax=Natronobacterium texcoconense TaxID=1095778 RepID=A0A1H1J2I7_NATTX|nr:hypothetical protein [Natronobacterium texcoconense]SDR44133.1 hypothetical protein SAMN04489842_4055 [Natronobacterium texcoconense]